MLSCTQVCGGQAVLGQFILPPNPVPGYTEQSDNVIRLNLDLILNFLIVIDVSIINIDLSQ